MATFMNVQSARARGLLRRLTGARARRLPITIVALCATVAIAAGATAAGAAKEAKFAAAKDATAPFHNLDVAMAAGYASFYKCTDEAGVGGMGQHFVKGPLVEDPALDTLRPEVLVYEPRAGGGYRLVAVEYVVLKEDWLKTHSKAPRLFGHTLKLVPAPNRYGLPDFYELHVWLWKANPRGVFNDWNPRVSCRGQGD
jgi:hypothetical protein